MRGGNRTEEAAPVIEFPIFSLPLSSIPRVERKKQRENVGSYIGNPIGVTVPPVLAWR